MNPLYIFAKMTANKKIPIEVQEKANGFIADFNLKNPGVKCSMFLGFEYLNGTIVGALESGNKAYPPRLTPPESGLGSFFKQIFGKL